MKTHLKIPIRLLTCVVMLMAFTFAAQSQINVSVTGATAACGNDGSATATATGGTAPYTFEWIDYNMNIISTVASPTNLHGGGYSVKVTDSNGAIGYGWAYITPPFQIGISVITAATCGMSDGEIMATVTGGTAPYTFQWGNGTVNVSSNNVDSLLNVPGGSLDLTVTDANGCFYSPDSMAYVWIIPTYSVTNSTTPSNCDDGTASGSVSSGTPVLPVSFAWSHYDSNLGATVNFSGANITGLEPGSYTLTATDAAGCEAYSYAYVSPGPNYLQTTASVTPSQCPLNNGAIDLTITSGGTPPFTYAWNTAATTQDISGLPSGNYTVQITDATGCVITRHKYVPGTSPVNVGISGVQPSCWNSDGSVTASASGGTAPYTYSWSNGPATATYGSLPIGYYSVTATDANGCTDYAWYNLQQSNNCWAHIQGTVYDDLNGNCVVDAGDSPLPAQIISLGSSQYYANSMQTGMYSIPVAPGSYSVFHTPQTGYTLNCPSTPYSITAVAGATYPGNDFYNQPDSIYKDLEVYMYCGPARPGFNQVHYIYVKNQSTFTQSGTLEFQHDPTFGYSYSIPASSSYNSGTGTVSFSFTGLYPNQSITYKVYTSVPSTAVIGTPTSSNAFVGSLTNDINTVNNYDTCNTTITGSYDPNIKEVQPQGFGPQGFITVNDKVLDYVIHFQNTGNDTAFTVVVKDTLDDNLYIPSFKITGATHNMEYIINGREVQFIFDNILLVDSLTNEPLSHGSVSFTIEQVPGLQPGDQIHNTAAIYFDYNTPIITNTTVNTISNSIGIEEVDLTNYEMVVYPNPFKEQATVAYKLDGNKDVVIRVTDMVGKVIYEHSFQNQSAGEHRHTMNFGAEVESGIYMVQMLVNGQQIVKKIVH